MFSTQMGHSNSGANAGSETAPVNSCGGAKAEALCGLGDGIDDALGDALGDTPGDDALVDTLGDVLGDTLGDALGDALADALEDVPSLKKKLPRLLCCPPSIETKLSPDTSCSPNLRSFRSA